MPPLRPPEPDRRFRLSTLRATRMAALTERRFRAMRSLVTGSHADIVMQAARTRQPTMVDAIAAVVLSGHRATYEAIRSLRLERAHRPEYPILLAARP